MNVTFYTRPNGNAIDHDITNVRDEDAQWFESNHVTISMEEIDPGIFAIYADVGLLEDDGETPMELIHITSLNESCEDALNTVRTMCEEAISET